MKTTKELTYAHGKNDSKNKEIKLLALTGSFAGKNVDQHVQVSTETKQRGFSNKVDVKTKTHTSYTTHLTLVDEKGEHHEYSVPGKDFTCPMNSLVTAMHIGEAGDKPCRLMYFKTHQNDQEFNYNRNELHKDVKLKNWPLRLLDLLGKGLGTIIMIIAVGTLLWSFSRHGEFLIALGVIIAGLLPFLLTVPYSKWQDKFDQFCHKESNSFMTEIHTKIKASQPATSNTHLDALSNINDQQDDFWSEVITEGQES